jgi:hypothetical protein
VLIYTVARHRNGAQGGVLLFLVEREDFFLGGQKET